MTEPIQPPRTIKVYQLVRQSGMSFSLTGTSGPISLGVGFYSTQQEAEHNRTLEVLKDSSTGLNKNRFHVFELEIPNPLYQE